MLDANIFSKYKTKQDFDREAEEFEFRKRQKALQEQLGNVQLQQAQASLNAPEQLGTEQLLAKAIQMGGVGNLTPQEQAQLQAADIAQRTKQSINPMTGQLVTNRSYFDLMGASPSQVNQMPPRQAMDMPMSNAPMGSLDDDMMLNQMQEQAEKTGGQPMTAPPPLPADMQTQPTQSIPMPNTQSLNPAAAQTATEEAIKANLELEKQRILQAEKDAKESVKSEKGQNQIDVVLSDMKADYEALRELEAIRQSGAPLSSNLINYLANTGIGQGVGQATGSQAEAIRERIRTAKPKMMGAMKDALGLTGTELNSQQELQFYLNALTDPSQDFETNMINIQRLSRDWGAGKFAPKQPKVFNSVQEAESANLPRGTELIINGRRAIVE